ncbi:hypothetical protein Spiaf_1683 [Spirochaeta africana DSM 8902]|uniref:Uncharacterized protein n=2 Tax=Spirochaeta TaxID=146 RepID=H9UJP7_SPIAZ|nr:hypothetical protein Spiaf_1683 [Spirochaeta africana DSM 8902]
MLDYSPGTPIHTSMKASIITVLLCGFLIPAVFAEQPSQDVQPITGFGDIEIGMSFDLVDQALRGSGVFQYRGEADVSLSPGRERIVMEVDGFDFVQRGIFQFIDDRLFSITLIINQSMMDHFTLFTRFQNSYGTPAVFGPRRILWEDGQNRLTLERPLTVQYLDLMRFEELRDQGRARESLRELSRELFLEQF